MYKEVKVPADSTTLFIPIRKPLFKNFKIYLNGCRISNSNWKYITDHGKGLGISLRYKVLADDEIIIET